MKTLTCIEDNLGNVIGFYGEEVKVSGGRNRGDAIQIDLLDADKTFHRSHILKVDPAQLGLDESNLPEYLGKGPDALQSPEDLRLFEPVEVQPETGKELVEALEKLTKDVRSKTQAPGRR